MRIEKRFFADDGTEFEPTINHALTLHLNACVGGGGKRGYFYYF